MGALITIGFGLFWLFCGVFVQKNGAPETTVLGIFGLGGLFLVIGVVGLFRNLAAAGRRARQASGGWRDDDARAGSSFDADAAIKRYMEQRPTEPAEQADRPSPGFGRKGI